MSIKDAIVKGFYTTKRFAGKYAPMGLIAGGTIAMAVGAIEYYKSKDEVNRVLDFYEDKEKKGEQFTRMNVAMDVSKAVAKPTLITLTGVAMIATGTAIYNKRMHLLTLGLAAVTEEHYRYRENARQVLGEEEFYKLETKPVEVTNEETGEVETHSVTVPNTDLFARWFQYSSKYEAGPEGHEYNIHILKDAEEWIQTQINKKGEILFAEAMEYLGFDIEPYQMQYVWYDTSGFYLEWSEHEVFNAETLQNELQLLVRWARPVPKYS